MGLLRSIEGIILFLEELLLPSWSSIRILEEVWLALEVLEMFSLEETLCTVLSTADMRGPILPLFETSSKDIVISDNELSLLKTFLVVSTF